jgi:prepilin-type N-terminal cleavage/methylation domain-containing protein
MTNKKGFTLIEVVLVIVLFTMLSLAVMDMYSGQNKIFNFQSSELIITNDARMALDEIDNYVRGSNRVLAAYDTYTTGASTLILQMHSLDATGIMIPGTFDTVLFYMDGSKLMRKLIPDASSSRQASEKMLADNVTSLTFTYNNADISLVTEVSEEIALSHSSATATRSITVSSKAILRNY